MEREYNVGTWLTPSDEYIKDIKQTLVEKGIVEELTNGEDIPENLKEELEKVIPDNLKAGVQIGNVKGTIATSLEEINPDSAIKVPAYFQNIRSNYVTTDKKKAYVMTIENDVLEIYFINLETNETKKLYEKTKPTAVNAVFFETSKGVVYATSGYDGVFILDGDYCEYIFNNVYNYFYETKDGLVYAGASRASSGILKIEYNNATEIYPMNITSNDSSYYNFYETKNGVLYVTSNSKNVYGIIQIKNGEANQIYSSFSGWNGFFETKNGDLYVFPTGSSSSSIPAKGIVKISNNIAERIYTLGYGFEQFIEINDNDLVCITRSQAANIIRIKDNEVTTFESGGSTNLKVAIKDPIDDCVYFAHIVGSVKSITKLDLNTNEISYLSSTYTGLFTNAFSFGDSVYFLGTQNYGILKVKQSVVSRIVSSGYWTYPFICKDEIYIGSSTTGYQGGVGYIKDDVFTEIYSHEAWQYGVVKENGVILSQKPTFSYSDKILYLTEGKAYEIKL